MKKINRVRMFMSPTTPDKMLGVTISEIRSNILVLLNDGWERKYKITPLFEKLDMCGYTTSDDVPS